MIEDREPVVIVAAPILPGTPPGVPSDRTACASCNVPVWLSLEVRVRVRRIHGIFAEIHPTCPACVLKRPDFLSGYVETPDDVALREAFGWANAAEAIAGLAEKQRRHGLA